MFSKDFSSFILFFFFNGDMRQATCCIILTLNLSKNYLQEIPVP